MFLQSPMPFESMPQRIYCFRHGQSIGNERGLDDNSLKNTANHRFELTTKGIDQAKKLAEYLSTENILDDVAKIYVSGFLRTQITLENAINTSCLKIPVYLDPRIDEWWKGIFHSLSVQEIDAYYPIERQVLEREKWHFYRPPQGESGRDVEIRLLQFFPTIKENALISGHGKTTAFMNRLLCQEQLDLNCEYEYPKNCELWLFEKSNGKYEKKSLFRPD